MSERPVLQPGPAHPITITPTRGRVTVTVNGSVVAESTEALTLQESNYPAVQYLPLADVDQSVLTRSTTASYCPYKGDAAYYHLRTTGGGTVTDAVWTQPERRADLGADGVAAAAPTSRRYQHLRLLARSR